MNVWPSNWIFTNKEFSRLLFLKYPGIKLDTILKSCKGVILIKNKENFMDQYICNYRTIGEISTTDISFLPSVYNFYKNDITMPKKSLDDMILLLSKDYGLTKVLYSELDRMTAESAISLINYNNPENNLNTPLHIIKCFFNKSNTFWYLSLNRTKVMEWSLPHTGQIYSNNGCTK